MSASSFSSHRVIRDDPFAAARARRRVQVAVARAERLERTVLRLNKAEENARSMARFSARTCLRSVTAVSRGAREMRAGRSSRSRAVRRGRPRSPGREPDEEPLPPDIGAVGVAEHPAERALGRRTVGYHELQVVALSLKARA